MPIAVAEPPPLRMAPLVAVGEWRVLGVRSGWLRYNPLLCRLEAHCGSDAACKMDRALRKGPAGLLCAWLVAGAELLDRAAHNDLKRVLSHGDAFARRVESREELRRLRVIHGGVYSEIFGAGAWAAGRTRGIGVSLKNWRACSVGNSECGRDAFGGRCR